MAAQAIAARWDFEIRGPAGPVNGDLRFAGPAGRILLQHDDSAFKPLHELRISAGRIAFSVGGRYRRFSGTVTDTVMRGSVIDKEGRAWPWQALPLDPRSTRWPVPPRVIMRQLAIGSDVTTERIAGNWLAAMPPAAQLDSDSRRLAQSLGLPEQPAPSSALAARRGELGLDPAVRAAARAELTRILARPGVDPRMLQLFRPGGHLKLDLHDAALDEARHYLVRFQLDDAIRALDALSAETEPADSAAARERAWRLWARMATDSVRIVARIDSLERSDPSGARSLRALLSGYRDAVRWWHAAVTLLLADPWLDTGSGLRSPAALMAEFWGTDTLPLPDIVPVPFGDVAAMPQVGVAHVARFMLRADNGVAAEWLAGDGTREAFDAWQAMDWGAPLSMVRGTRVVTVVSPVQEARARPAAFFGVRDAIRIDPGIMPFAAVAVLMHEWHHLIVEHRRLVGAHPVGIHETPVQVELRSGDPWLSEGLAEWATDQTLQPAGTSGALLRFTQAEKRRAIAAELPDDPHVLGYRMVEALVSRLGGPARTRDALVLALHDPNAVARQARLAGGTGRTLNRPANAAVIPEVTFSWDEGLAFDVSRRLLIPTTRPEP